MSELREEVRLGTLRRMRQALAETEDRLARLRDDGRSPDDREVREAEAYRDALARDIGEVAGPEGDLVVTVRLHANGDLVVAAPGDRMRIVAAREKLASAAGQRVAELVEEALQARERGGR
ncbi:protein of unknown function [Methylorubrum extorquens]|uniref:Uncharacterized protein n=1 Tax=Methylorubrum extorquens TaxID=408 RepID=A0A2N9AN66_METEX|nr:hypothetical protein ASF36_19100 [Methylobacterium sp. Leaf90]SOR28824.1 protein of unknown function [Methylorubrum extorquens]